jgi:hypothetical protein
MQDSNQKHAGGYYPPQQKMLKYKQLRHSSLGYKVEAQNSALVLFHAFWSEKLW